MRMLRVGLVALGALMLAACQLSDVPPERVPRFEPLSRPPGVALVLGSGGPRGFAHVGVIKALEAHGVKPDLIVGASVGAMVGALYAYGHDAAELERMARSLNVLTFLEWEMIGRRRASGEPMQAFVNEQVRNTPLERLRTPLVVAATSVPERKLVFFNRGDTGLAVRASTALPDQFEPVSIGGALYMDADEASPVPIRAARALGARVVIAVDVSAYEADTPADVPREWVEKDRRRIRQIASEAADADVLLHPNIGYYAGHDREYRERVMRLAEADTVRRMPEVRAAIARAQKIAIERSPAGVASR